MASFTQFFRKAKSVLRKVDPIGEKILQNTEDLPGTPGALDKALLAEGVSNNPYKAGEASRFDMFAGGKLAEDPDARKVGRAVGTALAIWFGGGAAGASSGNTGTAALQGAQGTTAYTAGKEAELAAEADAAKLQQTTEQGLDRLRKSLAQSPSAQFDIARRRSEQQDVFRRRKGRRASVLTGDTGVGFTPIGQRTLIGS